MDLVLPRLRPDQWAIVSHPAKIKVVSAGRRYGKSLMLGATLISAAVAGGKCALGAPSYKNTRPIWRWAESIVRPLVDSKLVVINRAERMIEFPQSGGFLGIYTLDNPDAMRGEAFHLVGIDEAARVQESAWTDVIQPTLADYSGDAIIISTPMGRNWFWREWQKGQEDGIYTKSWQAPTSDNPISGIQKAFERARYQVPEQTFRQEWLAEFVEDSMLLFSPEWWDGVNRYSYTDKRHVNTCIARYMSWDTAIKDASDNAYSACIVADLMPNYTIQIREVYRERLSFPRLISKIYNLARKYSQDGKLRNIIIEDRASGTSAYQTILAGGDEALKSMLVAFMPTVSKSQRASQAGVWCQNGSVLFPYPCEEVSYWLNPFEQELYAAPSELMDQVDAFSQLVLYTELLLKAGLDARRASGVQSFRQELILPSRRIA